jgi:Ser/Thr protein kinase RdoA (MazF antagonist)
MRPDAWSALRGLALRPVEGGLINATFVAGEPPLWVVQRVNHAIFRPEVHSDIAAVTAHLAARGRATPRLLPTDAGGLCEVTDEGEIWRVMDYLPGLTVHRVDSPARARAAGALVADFHAAVDDLEWDYRHVRPGAHDTVAHVAALATARAAPRTTAPEADAAQTLADAIAADWTTWDGRLDLPLRHAHGDLKISNLRFSADGRGLCLLDLDTLGRFSLDVELGDAFRSWCNPVGEDANDTTFDLAVFEAAVQGYASARAFTPDERAALVTGVERIALELASRFCRDVFEDRYFGWNAERFPSRVAHNLFRARGQLALARSVRAQRSAAERVVAALSG